MPTFNAYIKLLMMEITHFLLEPSTLVEQRALMRTIAAIILQAESVLAQQELKQHFIDKKQA